MRQASETPKRRSRSAARILSLAAAAVFLVGGTLLTRDQLSATSTPVTQVSERGETSGGTGYGVNGANFAMMDTAAPEEYATRSSSAESYSYTADSGAAQEETKIIRTVSLSLGSGAFADDLDALQDLCREAGGWVSYISVSGDAAQASRRASLTLRIPEEKLEEFLQGADGLGRVISQTETAEDVTATYQDTAARLATQQAKMERLQDLMSETATLSELLELESAIADTQYTLDSLQSQLNATDQQVSYATVDISLREESNADAVTSRDLTLSERLRAGLATGWETFWGFCKDMLVFLSAALPYLAAVGVIAALMHLIFHRRKSH